MPLITTQQHQQLIANFHTTRAIEAAGGNGWRKIRPVALLHTPEMQVGSPGAWETCHGTWLLIDAMPENPDAVGAIGDLGFGVVEYGITSLSSLERIGPPSSRFVTEIPFTPKHPVDVYFAAANTTGRITTDPEELAAAAREVEARVTEEGEG